jgi:hypothetical protein
MIRMNRVSGQDNGKGDDKMDMSDDKDEQSKKKDDDKELAEERVGKEGEDAIEDQEMDEDSQGNVIGWDKVMAYAADGTVKQWLGAMVVATTSGPVISLPEEEENEEEESWLMVPCQSRKNQKVSLRWHKG